MTNASDRLYNLLLARSASAISLANIFLGIADPCSGTANDIAPWGDGNIQMHLQDTEALTCGLMHYSGVSWDAMATRYQVSRQSLHRRMASLADKYSTLAQEHPDVNRSQTTFAQGILNYRGPHVIESLSSELDNAVNVWEHRRQHSGWWRDEQAVENDWQ